MFADFGNLYTNWRAFCTDSEHFWGKCAANVANKMLPSPLSFFRAFPSKIPCLRNSGEGRDAARTHSAVCRLPVGTIAVLCQWCPLASLTCRWGSPDKPPYSRLGVFSKSIPCQCTPGAYCQCTPDCAAPERLRRYYLCYCLCRGSCHPSGCWDKAECQCIRVAPPPCAVV